VVIVHGYYDHVGIVRNAVAWALEAGFAVAAFDLPGHGLSTGARSSIKTFSHYAGALHEFMEYVPKTQAQPVFLVGHSTGCAAIFEYLHTRGNPSVHKAILLAPLVRGAYHHLSVAGYHLMKNFVSMTTRWFRNASSDKDFLEWFRHDPLQYDRFPIEWGSALYAWQEKIASYEPSETPVHIIQGSRDNVVDAKYNIPFLRRKFTDVTVTEITGAKHQLLNESKKYRQKVRDDFLKELESFEKHKDSGLTQ
jgi:alpha-beta hydrolase superfamily lysophospholipase